MTRYHSLFLRCMFCALFFPCYAKAQAPAVNPHEENSFFSAQLKARENHAELKQAEQNVKDARAAHAAKRGDREAKEAGRGDRSDRQKSPNKMIMRSAKDAAAEKSFQESRRAEAEAEIKAEAAQIAFEEKLLEHVLNDNPALKDSVEAQRKEIGVRKHMLDLRTQALTPPAKTK